MRVGLLTAAVALVLAAPAASAGWSPSAGWLAQARCVHAREGGWSANTGNGYFGGFQFAAATWRAVGGKPDAAFTHPGTPFSASPAEQLYRAWLLWRRDGGTWRSWGGVGATCSVP